MNSNNNNNNNRLLQDRLPEIIIIIFIVRSKTAVVSFADRWLRDTFDHRARGEDDAGTRAPLAPHEDAPDLPSLPTTGRPMSFTYGRS